MLDLMFIGLLVGFFAVALLLVRLCESVVTPERASSSPAARPAELPLTVESPA